MPKQNLIIEEIENFLKHAQRHEVSGITIAIIRNDLKEAVANDFESDWEEIVNAVKYLHNRVSTHDVQRLRKVFKK